MILIGTRGSSLALAQARGVLDAFRRLHPKVPAELETVKTSGDDWSASGEKTLSAVGVFVRELDEALRSGRIRAAVHSLKDVPARSPGGIRYTLFPAREDPRDALVTRNGRGLADLPEGARIGTSSPRRVAFLSARRRDLAFVSLRGNVDTRLRRLEEGEVDALVVAAAGLSRLGLLERASEILDPAVLPPAPGQGTLCVALREEDEEAWKLFSPLHHPETGFCAAAERAFLRVLEGGCRLPAGALAHLESGRLQLTAAVAEPSGRAVIGGSRQGAPEEGERMGQDLAWEILWNGGAEILQGLKGRPLENS